MGWGFTEGGRGVWKRLASDFQAELRYAENLPAILYPISATLSKGKDEQTAILAELSGAGGEEAPVLLRIFRCRATMFFIEKGRRSFWDQRRREDRDDAKMMEWGSILDRIWSAARPPIFGFG